MAFHGHTLIWNTWIPAWVTSGGYSRDSLFGVMRSHIMTVVGRYKGKVASWDVLNEMLDYWPGTTLQTSFWLTQLGPEYMDSAFVWAHRADPAAKLYVNENLTEFGSPKTDALFAMVQGMRSRGVPIDGVGFQMHAPLGHPSYPAYNTYKTDPISSIVGETFARFANAGFDIRITEFDAELADTAGLAALEKQGQVYRDVLDACLRVSRCHEMTTWGMTDKYSWIPVTRPGYGRALPFDAAYQAKPAFDSLLARLGLP
jgi:endo-1,4-beta-xylanase